MTVQLAAQALAVAANPNASPSELIDATGELITFGDFDAAEAVLARLQATGRFGELVRRSRATMDWLRSLGPQFDESFLRGATAVLDDESADPKKLLKAAETLIVWGALDDADRALARLPPDGVFRGAIVGLTAAARQLRRSGMLSSLQTLTPTTSLNKPYEVLIAARPGRPRRTIIVFTGIASRFWLSLNALNQYLKKLDANVIYLNDHSGLMYMNGLASVGPGYGSMLRMLEKKTSELGADDIVVLATSAGGFVGLRAAADLKARCFAGMSIRTSMAPASPVPFSPFEKHVIQGCRYPEMLVDLRPEMEAAAFPRRIQLYCGDRSKIDRAHADHLAGIARVEVNYLQDYPFHDAISGLISRGEFGRMLDRFVGRSEREAAPAHA